MDASYKCLFIERPRTFLSEPFHLSWVVFFRPGPLGWGRSYPRSRALNNMTLPYCLVSMSSPVYAVFSWIIHLFPGISNSVISAHFFSLFLSISLFTFIPSGITPHFLNFPYIFSILWNKIILSPYFTLLSYGHYEQLVWYEEQMTWLLQ